ncbi:MAG: LptF/LptG family permease [Deltaproteobacteria bacterium]|jgi:lipopolysaccharide export system permease protein|nr:LptF/LptG family permease [Deltaproteobacteria bacterium]
MRSARTLSLYLIRETLFHCALAFFVLTLVLLTQNLLRRLDDLLLVGMTASDVRAVLACVLPVMTSYALPLAFLVGILLSIRRLAADGELVAMRATGIGPTTFLLPHLALGLMATLLSGWLLGSVEHESRRELVQLFGRVAARGAILEPGKFRRIGQRLVFVEDRERDGELRGIMIYDESRRDRPYRIFADRGRFQFDEQSARIRLELWDGDLHLTPSSTAPGRYERIRFDAFDYHVDVGYLLGAEFGPVRPKQMDLDQLRGVLARAARGDPLRELDQRDPLHYELEIHRRRALPLAPLLFAGVGVPIALASEHRGRMLGLLLCLLAAFAYYALAALAGAMAETGWLDAAMASWLPNVIFAGLGVALAIAERGRIPS